MAQKKQNKQPQRHALSAMACAVCKTSEVSSFRGVDTMCIVGGVCALADEQPPSSGIVIGDPMHPTGGGGGVGASLIRGRSSSMMSGVREGRDQWAARVLACANNGIAPMTSGEAKLLFRRLLMLHPDKHLHDHKAFDVAFKTVMSAYEIFTAGCSADRVPVAGVSFGQGEVCPLGVRVRVRGAACPEETEVCPLGAARQETAQRETAPTGSCQTSVSDCHVVIGARAGDGDGYRGLATASHTRHASLSSGYESAAHAGQMPFVGGGSVFWPLSAPARTLDDLGTIFGAPRQVFAGMMATACGTSCWDNDPQSTWSSADPGHLREASDVKKDGACDDSPMSGCGMFDMSPPPSSSSADDADWQRCETIMDINAALISSYQQRRPLAGQFGNSRPTGLLQPTVAGSATPPVGAVSRWAAPRGQASFSCRAAPRGQTSSCPQEMIVMPIHK